MAISRLSSIPSTQSVIAGSPIFPNNITINGRLDIAEIRESIADGTITTNILPASFLVSNNWFVSSPAAAFTVNATNIPTDNGKVITIIVIVSQGATGYIPNAVQIDGAAQTLRWIGGVTPTATSSSGKLDVFNFTLIRRASAWTVLGNAALNF
jgi:hypothetical protein